jgi:hypothetical protein
MVTKSVNTKEELQQKKSASESNFSAISPKSRDTAPLKSLTIYKIVGVE